MDADLFLQQFGHLAQGEGGIKKLRDVILQLAVQGRLVKQNASEESAEFLLKRMNIQKSKKVSETPVPFAIPVSWRWVKLNEIAALQIGKTPSRKETTYWSEAQYPWVSIADLKHLTTITSTKEGITELAARDCFNSRISPKGTLVMSFKLTIGKTSFLGMDAYHNEAIISIFPKIDELKIFMFWALSGLDLTTEQSNAIKGNTLNREKLENLNFPLPPLAEQKRIVAKVDELMALCDKLEAEQKAQRTLKTQAVQSTLYRLTSNENSASFGNNLNILERTFGNWFDDIATVKQLRTTILQLAIRGSLSGDPEAVKTTSLPKNWRQCKLGELLSFGPKNGYSPKPVDYETQTKSLTLSATTSGSFDASKTKFIDETIPTDSHLWLDKGDILIQRGNSSEYVGVSAIYNGKRGIFVYPDLMMKIRVTEDAIPEYIHLALLAPTTRAYFLKNATGTSGSMPKINQAVVKNTPISLPPLAEQKRIVAKVGELMTLCDQLEAHITHTQTLNTHLMDSLIHRMTEAA